MYKGMDALPQIVDMHCHVLPGVDDGPATMEDSIAILREAGVRAWEYLAVRLLAGALTASFVALQLAGEFQAVSFAPRPFHMAALCAAFLAVPPILYVARGKS